MVAGCLLFTGFAGGFSAAARAAFGPAARTENGVPEGRHPAESCRLLPGADGPDGFEYALVREFARHLRRGATAVSAHGRDPVAGHRTRRGALWSWLDFAITPARELRVRFSTPYEFVTEQVIYCRGSARPRSFRRLPPATCIVVAGSSHDEHLTKFSATQRPWSDLADT